MDNIYVQWAIDNWAIILGAVTGIIATIKTIKTTVTAGFKLLGGVFEKKEDAKSTINSEVEKSRKAYEIQKTIGQLRINRIAMRDDAETVEEIDRQITEQTSLLNQL